MTSSCRNFFLISFDFFVLFVCGFSQGWVRQVTSSCCNFVSIYLDFLILICRGELQLTIEYLCGVFHVELGCGVFEGRGVEEREVKRIW